MANWFKKYLDDEYDDDNYINTSDREEEFFTRVKK